MWMYNCGCGGLTVSPMNRCAAVRTAGHWGHTEVQLYSGITAQAFHSVRVSPDTDFTKNKSPGRNQLAIFIGDMLRTALVLWPLLLERKDPQASSKVTIKAASCPSHASPLCLAMLRSWRGRGTQILVFLVGVWNTYFFLVWLEGEHFQECNRMGFKLHTLPWAFLRALAYVWPTCLREGPVNAAWWWVAGVATSSPSKAWDAMVFWRKGKMCGSLFWSLWGVIFCNKAYMLFFVHKSCSAKGIWTLQEDRHSCCNVLFFREEKFKLTN